MAGKPYALNIKNSKDYASKQHKLFKLQAIEIKDAEKQTNNIPS